MAARSAHLQKQSSNSSNDNNDGAFTTMSSARQKATLSRSRSLSSPLVDGDINASISEAVDPCPATSVCRGGSSSKYQVDMVSGQSSGSSEVESAKGKKPLRRQKSLAEVFGVVIYKSKVQLQELFSRRSDHKDRKRREASRERFSRDTSPGFGVEAAGAAIDHAAAVDEGFATVGSSPSTFSVSSFSPRMRKNRTPQPLLPRGPLVMSHPDLTVPLPYEGSRDRRRACSKERGGRYHLSSAGSGRVRTPEEIFCVVRVPNDRLERPLSSRSLDTLQRRRDSNNSGDSSPRGDSPDPASPQCSKEHLLKPGESDRNARRLLKPENEGKAKTKLVKSHSDSLYRLAPPSAQQGMVKACSDDVCFVKRSPKTSNKPGSTSSSPKPAISPSGVRDGGSNVSIREADTVSAVLDWLLVGSVEAAYNDPLLCALGVDAIVDLTNVAPHLVPVEKKTTCPCTCNDRHFRSKLNLAVDDIEWENIEQYFPDVNAFLNGWRQKERKVLVVSYNGKSRAPALVAQYLMQHYRLSLDQALQHLRGRRPQTRLNSGFMRALQRLQKRLNEENILTASSTSSAAEPPPEFPEEIGSGSVLIVPCTKGGRKTAWDER